jgi:hypothetical protein
MPFDDSSIRNNENKMINSLKITKEAEDYFKSYGLLQYCLMNSNPSIIALGLVKSDSKKKSDYLFKSQKHFKLD